ncbi:hypothetical protein D3C71_1883870 [compost metagenome]
MSVLDGRTLRFPDFMQRGELLGGFRLGDLFLTAQPRLLAEQVHVDSPHGARERIGATDVDFLDFRVGDHPLPSRCPHERRVIGSALERREIDHGIAKAAERSKHLDVAPCFQLRCETRPLDPT